MSVQLAFTAGTLEDRFWSFHSKNPEVYTELVKRTRAWRDRHAHRKLAIATVFEVVRWFHYMETEGDEFKLNNSFRSFYARLIMASEPDLADVFETRSSQADLSVAA